MRKNSVKTALGAALCSLVIAACGSAPPADAPPSTPGVVNLNKTELTVIVGSAETLVASNRNASWASDNDEIASVDSSGRVTGKYPGMATITAAAMGNKSGECVVYVRLVKMVQIKGGTFQMGNADQKAPKDEQPQHDVTVSDFYMGAYPVTQAQYRFVMEDEPSRFKGDDLPVEQVSWYETLIFCNKLSMIEGLDPVYQIGNSTDPDDWGAVPTRSSTAWNAAKIVEGANGYRLPTEAQWEFACRAGTNTYFHTGTTLSSAQANYDGREPFNSRQEGEYRETTTAVNSFPPNAWGLYDMHGNVWEWCWDWHALYLGGAVKDPQGDANGAFRIARGGSWKNSGRSLRSSSRGNSDPAFKNVSDTNSLGFRLARSE